MPRPISNKPGDAKIDRQGQTANSKFGSDPTQRGVSRPAPHDLKP